MKNIILASVLALGFSAFAQEGMDSAPAEKKEVVKTEKKVKHGKHEKKEKKTEMKKTEGAE